MNNNNLVVFVAIGAFIWPILVAIINRSFMNGANEQRIKNIERDVKDIRDYFMLTPRIPPRE